MMEQQTYAGPVVWHVVDDGVDEMPVTFKRPGYDLRPYRLPASSENTQGRNLIHLLAQVDPGQPITVWEDDDWYDPLWLETVVREIDKAELIGEPLARYYNVKQRRYKRFNNMQHCSLRCSAMRGSAVTKFRQTLERPELFYDIRLWREFAGSKHLIKSELTVGIKGMPGRAGIGGGHREMWGQLDTNLDVLRKWTGEGAEIYAPYYDEAQAMKALQTRMMVAEKPFKYRTRRLLPGDTFAAESDKDAKLWALLKKARPATANETAAVVAKKPAAPREAPPPRVKEREQPREQPKEQRRPPRAQKDDDADKKPKADEAPKVEASEKE